MKSERVPHPLIQISSCIPPGWQHPHRRIQNSKFSFKFCRLKTLGSQRPPVGAPNRRQSIPRFDASKFPQFDVRPIAPRKSQIDNVGSTNCKPPAPHHSHGHGCAPVACARFVLGHSASQMFPIKRLHLYLSVMAIGTKETAVNHRDGDRLRHPEDGMHR